MGAAPRAVSTSVVLALVLTAVWLFWPLGLGGGTTYLSTYGNSMEPRFQAGDLAILRADDRYAVGDVVAFRSPSMNTVVMHRIVSEDGAGFVTQGDNNDWLDDDRPSREQILGRIFLRVPKGGIALDAITSPGAFLFVVAGLLTVLANARRPRDRGQLRVPGRSAARRMAAYSMPTRSLYSMPTRSLARQVAVGSGAVALVALVGGGVLLVLPSTQTDTRTLQVTQQGRFSYTGAAQQGTTYPSGVIETGDTVWTKLARSVTVSFTNTVIGPELTELQGTMRLDVSVTASDGWSAVVQSGPAVALGSGAGTASVTVDPSAAAALLSRHYAEIGGVGGGSTLAVTPVVELTGRIAGQAFTAGSPEGLPFTLEAAALRPSGDPATAMEGITQTAVEVQETVPRTIAVLGLVVPIGVARSAAGGVLAVALLALGAGAWIGRTGRGDVADQFLVRHADRILPVAGFTPGPTVFDVADAESLHRVAERFDTVVLHHAGPDEDVFAVRDADATYRFVVPGSPGRRRGTPPVPGAAVQIGAPPIQPAPSARPDRAGPPPPAPDPTVPLPRIADEPRDAAPSAHSVISIPRPTGRHWGRVA